jgi:hypothetical protein
VPNRYERGDVLRCNTIVNTDNNSIIPILIDWFSPNLFNLIWELMTGWNIMIFDHTLADEIFDHTLADEATQRYCQTPSQSRKTGS